MANFDEEWLADDGKDNENDFGKRRSSHIRSCCVPICTSKGYRLLVEGERVQYFQFPLDDSDLCKRWMTACKIPSGTQLDKAFVCSKHFRITDYKARALGEKKSLRRTAVPSYDSVVTGGRAAQTPKKKRKVSDSETTTDEESEAEVAPAAPQMKQFTPAVTTPMSMKATPRVAATQPNQITTVVEKSAMGEKMSVVVVKNPADQRQDVMDNIEKPPVLANAKKVPLLLTDLLATGPPYPWRKQGLEVWTTERLQAHEEQVAKIAEATNEEVEKINLLQEQIEARKELLALVVIKKSLGRMVLSQYLRTL